MTELAMPERKLTVAGDYAFEQALYEWLLVPNTAGESVRACRYHLLRSVLAARADGSGPAA